MSEQPNRATALLDIANRIVDPARSSGFGRFVTQRVEIDDTAGGQTLAALLGFAVPSWVKEIVIVAEDATAQIRIDTGAAASATSVLLPAGGMALSLDKPAADTVRLFSATSAYAGVMLFGD